MARELEIYKETRLVAVRFERAVTGDPQIEYPDIDDRAYNFKVPAVDGLAESKEIRGPLVGVTKQKKIKLNLVRELIDNAVPVFITSSDTDVVKILSPADGKPLPSTKKCEIELQGGDFAGAKPKSAHVEVRFESDDGPILYELTVYVFTPLPVFIQPHVVTINNMAGTGGIAPAINIAEVMKQVQALWAPVGIRFIIQTADSWSVNLPGSNVMRWEDVNTVLAKKWRANAINVYIVREIGNALGYGFSKAAHAGFGVSKPSAFAGERLGTIARGPAHNYWWANDLAHELGHFFTLWHPTDGPNTSNAWKRYDTWSMRFLMHNWNYTGRGNPPGNAAHWPEFNDFGYGLHGPGQPFRSGMVPLKNVRTAASAGRDGQTSAVRNHILKGPANLY